MRRGTAQWSILVCSTLKRTTDPRTSFIVDCNLSLLEAHQCHNEIPLLFDEVWRVKDSTVKTISRPDCFENSIFVPHPTYPPYHQNFMRLTSRQLCYCRFSTKNSVCPGQLSAFATALAKTERTQSPTTRLFIRSSKHQRQDIKSLPPARCD